MTSPSSATWKPEIDALLNTIIYATITRDEFRDRLHTLLHAAVEQERERCRGVAMTRRVELLEAATEFNVRGWNRKAREYEMRADAAYEIATRIAREGETK